MRLFDRKAAGPTLDLSWTILKTRLLSKVALITAAIAAVTWWIDVGHDGTTMCGPDGTCYESADIPSPRTVHTARNQLQLDRWWEVHAALNRSAEVYSAADADLGAGAGRPLVLLGDSITEAWVGTSYGRPSDRSMRVPEVLRDYVSRNPAKGGNQWRTLVLAISGDQTQHLLWRLMHGELRPSLSDDEDAVFVVLIGTNNLGSGHGPEETAAGVTAVAKYLLESTNGRVLLLSVLPRGDGQYMAQFCPPRCDSEGKPFDSFMPDVKLVNNRLDELARTLSKIHQERFRHVDCGAPFHGDDGYGKSGGVKKSLMPDLLHPNAQGHVMLLKCIMDCAERDQCGD